MQSIRQFGWTSSNNTRNILICSMVYSGFRSFRIKSIPNCFEHIILHFSVNNMLLKRNNSQKTVLIKKKLHTLIMRWCYWKTGSWWCSAKGLSRGHGSLIAIVFKSHHCRMTVCCLYDEILYFIIQFDFKMAGSETVVERCVRLVTSVGRRKNSESSWGIDVFVGCSFFVSILSSKTYLPSYFYLQTLRLSILLIQTVCRIRVIWTS